MQADGIGGKIKPSEREGGACDETSDANVCELQRRVDIEERIRVQTRTVCTAYSPSRTRSSNRSRSEREKSAVKTHMHRFSYPALHTGAARTSHAQSRRRATASERTRTVHAGAQSPTRPLCRHRTRSPNARSSRLSRELIQIVAVVSPVVRPSPCHQVQVRARSFWLTLTRGR